MKVDGPANFFLLQNVLVVYYVCTLTLCSDILLLNFTCVFQDAVSGDNEHSAQGVQTQPTVEFPTQHNQ